MLDSYRDQPMEGIIFRAAHPVVDSLAPYPAAERAARLPGVIRRLLASVLEGVAAAEGTREGTGAR
jgi:hypothetical protein